LEFDGLNCLDLFAGTGNISFELASRGVEHVDSVDLHFKCVQYITDTAKKMKLGQINARKADVFKFINSCKSTYDLIFADPPYDIPKLPQLPKLVFDNNLLNNNGLLIVEHPSTRQMEEHPNFIETRKYGYSSFSFYAKPL